MSSVEVKVCEGKIFRNILLAEVPSGTYFIGTIGNNENLLWFKNHIGIVCLNPSENIVIFGGIGWSTEDFKKLEVVGYRPK
jgi:hypothetical protein